MNLQNIEIAKKNMKGLWDQRTVLGLESAVEKMQEHINQVLQNTNLGRGRFDIALTCYLEITKVLPSYKPAQDYFRSYAE